MPINIKVYFLIKRFKTNLKHYYLTYAGSDIQQYVNGTATNSLYTRYRLSDYEIYNKISLKTC